MELVWIMSNRRALVLVALSHRAFTAGGGAE